jgi:hypothetical protein
MFKMYEDTWVIFQVQISRVFTTKGWKDKKKTKELKEDAAKYIIVIDNKTEELVGVVHFRFDVEDERETIYW